jgi:hypothetical protein
MSPTKTVLTMENAEREYASSDPERAEVIACARRFKSSWVELAAALTRIKRGGQWSLWGYDSFDHYAKSELHLRQETVEKLTGSYLFLQKRAPNVLERDGLSSPLPSYQAVDFLRRAEEADGAPSEALGEIHRLVVDEGAPLAAVARQYKDVVFPVTDEERKSRDAATLRSAAGRLRDLLPETKAVPKKLAREVGVVLERLLTALGDGAEEAA